MTIAVYYSISMSVDKNNNQIERYASAINQYSLRHSDPQRTMHSTCLLDAADDQVQHRAETNTQKEDN